jgi:hypothetical protein
MNSTDQNLKEINIFRLYSSWDGALALRLRHGDYKTGHARTNLLYGKDGGPSQTILLIGSPRQGQNG